MPEVDVLVETFPDVEELLEELLDVLLEVEVLLETLPDVDEELVLVTLPLVVVLVIPPDELDVEVDPPVVVEVNPPVEVEVDPPLFELSISISISCPWP